ncbi:BamA/TamA family outer membrane protein [Robertkochia flava]|uniref:BamA/TamA family outer membrane protein n=1 Tax=Robertkochia flava TaxID=3447986 RepID=UPI001CCA8C87|nr:BamA/TamA family outer membrane protein [Robertkochia marina]
MGRLSIIWLLFLFSLSLKGQERDGLPLDTLKGSRNLKFIGIPIAFYTPETQFGVGGGAQLFLLNNTNRFNERVSQILFSGIYTSAGQVILGAAPEVYLGRGNYFIDADYQFEIYPNYFWGIGPETPEDAKEAYNQTSHVVTVSFLKRLPPDLNFGFTYTFANYQITEVEEGRLLDSGTVPGSDRTVISGLGAEFNLDTRNEVSSPTKGSLLKFSAHFSSEVFGATHGYNKFQLDLRHYIQAGTKGTFASQLYVETNYGQVPFQGKAHFGGSSKGRGYFYGRFIDDHMYILQGEYRYRFKPRWAIAAFGLFGDVAGDTSDLFELNRMKPAFGGGVRFKILKDQNTWVRLDFGKGKGEQSGIYFGVNEAF